MRVDIEKNALTCPRRWTGACGGVKVTASIDVSSPLYNSACSCAWHLTSCTPGVALRCIRLSRGTGMTRTLCMTCVNIPATPLDDGRCLLDDSSRCWTPEQRSSPMTLTPKSPWIRPSSRKSIAAALRVPSELYGTGRPHNSRNSSALREESQATYWAGENVLTMLFP